MRYAQRIDIGGKLTEGGGWVWGLFVNVPITLVAAVLAPRLLEESRDTRQKRYFDVAGAVTVTAGLALGVYALQAAEAGAMCLVGQRTPPLLAMEGFTGAAIGHNPIAFGCPAQGDSPIVFDIAERSEAQLVKSWQARCVSTPDWLVAGRQQSRREKAAAQQYRFLVGTEAQRIAKTPEMGERYLCTDTKRIYYCLTNGTWTWMNRTHHTDLTEPRRTEDDP